MADMVVQMWTRERDAQCRLSGRGVRSAIGSRRPGGTRMQMRMRTRATERRTRQMLKGVRVCEVPLRGIPMSAAHFELVVASRGFRFLVKRSR